METRADVTVSPTVASDDVRTFSVSVVDEADAPTFDHHCGPSRLLSHIELVQRGMYVDVSVTGRFDETCVEAIIQSIQSLPVPACQVVVLDLATVTASDIDGFDGIAHLARRWPLLAVSESSLDVLRRVKPLGIAVAAAA